MALIADLQFTGTAGTLLNNGGSDYTPDVGSKWIGEPSQIPTLDGSGNLGQVVAPSYRLARAPFTIGDGTCIVSFRHGSVGYTAVMLRAAATGTFPNGYKIRRVSFAGGIELQRNGTTVGTWSTGAVDQFSNLTNYDEAHIVIEGGRIRVWVNGNVGTPDIDYTDGSPLSDTALAVEASDTDSNSGAKYDRLRWWDEIIIPAPPTYPKNDNQDPRRILKRITRSRLFKAA